MEMEYLYIKHFFENVYFLRFKQSGIFRTFYICIYILILFNARAHAHTHTHTKYKNTHACGFYNIMSFYWKYNETKIDDQRN